MTAEFLAGGFAPAARRLCRHALVLLVCACAPGDDAGLVPDQTPDDTARAQESVPPDSARGTPVVYVEGEFPHGAHSGVSCSACHGAMPGHATHAQTQCVECHVAPDARAAARPSPAECSACHHAADRPQPCAHCHASLPAARAVIATFRVAERPPAVRPLSFDHTLHDGLACRTCHTGAVTLAVERPCSSCHEDHHRSAADCAACHAAFPLATHGVTAHRGCADGGCHGAAHAFATPAPRNVCLVCHRVQVDHEPGLECRECHLLVGADP